MQVIGHRRRAVNLTTGERVFSAVAGGALAAAGVRWRGGWGIGMAALGGEMIRRALTGHSYAYEALGVRSLPKGEGAENTSVPYELGVRVDRAVTIARPRGEVYRFWRDLENLPRFMKHLESVRQSEDGRSHWVATAPAGRRVEWDAVIHNEVPDELMAWRTLPGSDVESAGSVLFRDAPGGRGTEVKVELQYNPPAGALGALVAHFFGEEPGQQIDEDLHRLKQLLEAGEIPTTDGQPSGRAGEARGPRRGSVEKTVQRASEESFPASDSPAYNMSR